jgi:hypothetical protein
MVEPVIRKMKEEVRRWLWDDYQWGVTTNRQITNTVTDFMSNWDLWLTPTLGTRSPKGGFRDSAVAGGCCDA